MPRIAGIDIPEFKKVFFSIQSVYGIGPANAKAIMKDANIDPDKRARDLTADEINRIQRVIEGYTLEGNLRRIVNENVDRLKRIKTYRGSRHAAGLPARGQRTRSNARTKRGGRRTVGSMTKETAAKIDGTKAA